MTVDDVIYANRLIEKIEPLLEQQNDIIKQMRESLLEYEEFLQTQIKELRDATN